jgi:hypothetical protein
MRKLMVLAAMLAMTMLVAAPALAQSSFDFDNSDNFDRGDFFDLFVDDNNDDFDNRFFDDNGFGGFGGFEQETDETGNVDLNSEIVNTGNNSNQCAAPLQFGNTGNLQNEQGFVTLGSSSDDGFDNNGFFDNNGSVDDVDFEGSTLEFAPEQAVQCDQAVQQSAAASG